MSNFKDIENYLFGNLNEGEKNAFESRLNNDTTLQTELEIHRKEHRAMQYLHEQRLRDKMKTWQKPEAKVVSIFASQNFKYALAASFVGICMVFMVRLWNSEPNYQEMAMNQHQMPSLALYRSAASETKNIDNIAILVVQTEYEKALGQLETLPPDDFEVQLLKATCFFKQKKFADAEKMYKNLAATAKKPTVGEEMKWNLALTLLAKNGKDDAEFKQIITELRNVNFQKAKDLKIE